MDPPRKMSVPLVLSTCFGDLILPILLCGLLAKALLVNARLQDALAAGRRMTSFRGTALLHGHQRFQSRKWQACNSPLCLKRTERRPPWLLYNMASGKKWDDSASDDDDTVQGHRRNQPYWQSFT